MHPDLYRVSSAVGNVRISMAMRCFASRLSEQSRSSVKLLVRFPWRLDNSCPISLGGGSWDPQPFSPCLLRHRSGCALENCRRGGTYADETIGSDRAQKVRCQGNVFRQLARKGRKGGKTECRICHRPPLCCHTRRQLVPCGPSSSSTLLAFSWSRMRSASAQFFAALAARRC